MTQTETTVRRAVESLIERRGNGRLEVLSDSRLQEDLGFDSLELAELSALLEEELGRDPYSEGIVPRTVGGILAFYRD